MQGGLLNRNDSQPSPYSALKLQPVNGPQLSRTSDIPSPSASNKVRGSFHGNISADLIWSILRRITVFLNLASDLARRLLRKPNGPVNGLRSVPPRNA